LLAVAAVVVLVCPTHRLLKTTTAFGQQMPRVAAVVVVVHL
jgi:hypothetical protein